MVSSSIQVTRLLHTMPVCESNRRGPKGRNMADERKVAVVTGSALNIGRATALVSWYGAQFGEGLRTRPPL
jgi:hypothetical protein